MKKMIVKPLLMAFALTLTQIGICSEGPYGQQVQKNIALLKSPNSLTRAAAAERLGFMRALQAGNHLQPLASDLSKEVRREAVMALGWCGNRDSLPTLLKSLQNKEWTVAQSAWCALCNITGMNFPFDALGSAGIKVRQVKTWQNWVKENSAGKVPQEVKQLLNNCWNPNLAYRKKVIVSTNENEPGCGSKRLTDGERERLSWLVKKDGSSQYCQIDLKKQQEISCIMLYQSQLNRLITEYSVEVSNDGSNFNKIVHAQNKTLKEQEIYFAPVQARYVRLTVYDNTNENYLATIHEIEVYKHKPEPEKAIRALRALGMMRWSGSRKLVLESMAPYLEEEYVSEPQRKQLVQAGIRALGRLKGEESFIFLKQLLRNPQWAHYAAEALIDTQHPKAASEIINVFADYSLGPNREKPKKSHPVDRPGLSPIDRMYCAPYSFALALSALPWSKVDQKTITDMIHLFVANMPGDYDTAMLYEPEAWHGVFSNIFERTGTRKNIIKTALAELGCDISGNNSFHSETIKRLAAKMKKFGGHNNEAAFAATWLPALCREGEFVNELESLLTSNDGWIRINAAKALMFTNSRKSAPLIYKILKNAKVEADYGLHGEFHFWNNKPDGQDEFNDPCPRWREAYVMALAQLEYTKSVPLLVSIMNDERSVLEVRYAAAKALDQLGTEKAVEALKHAASKHQYFSIKLAGREALWRRGLKWNDSKHPVAIPAKMPKLAQSPYEGEIVFIKGDKQSHNHYQMDNWRQLYGTTDSGPTYRHGRNIFRLNRKTGETVAITDFTDGFVADIEVSWDADEIIFARRGGDKDPWWHIFRVSPDGLGLKQLTFGYFHHVQPDYLPDGRIVFSTSRLGMRDEYHGYYATGIAVMNRDGSNIDCISSNLGRDAEPVILNDGRIGFSRLELFYSRMKTEWNLEAIYPDGTKNVVLYGPEFRQFWYNYTNQQRIPWTVSGLRHRTLRVSQMRPFGKDRFICITQKGLTIAGPGRLKQSFVPHDQMMAVTTPSVLNNNEVLCAAGKKIYKEHNGQIHKTNRIPIDLGLYVADIKTGKLKQIYNDPQTADFEPRLLQKRQRPARLPEMNSSAFTGKILCSDARISQENRTGRRGCYVRVVEGRPAVARHQTHTAGGKAWKNHTGTHARVLGTVPLAADGSFYLEVPADHLFHCQILDADRQVVGNQLIWMYSRPDELKSCVGCHEVPDSTPKMSSFAQASRRPAVKCLPYGGEFSYRAKYWNKGSLPDEGEERVRSTRAVNLIGRE